MLLVVVHPRSIALRMKLLRLRVAGEWGWAGVSGWWQRGARGLQALLDSAERHAARKTVDAAAGD